VTPHAGCPTQIKAVDSLGHIFIASAGNPKIAADLSAAKTSGAPITVDYSRTPGCGLKGGNTTNRPDTYTITGIG
jgi:hypothetical protein